MFYAIYLYNIWSLLQQQQYQMGKNNSKMLIQQYISKFEVIFKDENHNLTYLKQKRTSNQFLLKQIFANDKQSLNYIQNQLERRKFFNHPNITQLKQYYISDDHQFCSTIYHCNILYQFPFRAIEQQRNQRTKSNLYFNHDEILNIIVSLVSGFSYLQKNYIQHQSVRSSNIYIDLKGIIKISDPYAKQLQINYQLYRNSMKSPLIDGVYLSPNQLKSLKQQQKTATHNPYKSDVFCFGIVLLELSNLTIQDQIYNITKGTINEILLNKQIQNFGRRYGNNLKKILSMMLSLNESQRLDWNELQIFVKKQQRQKNQRESFDQNTMKQIKTNLSHQNVISNHHVNNISIQHENMAIKNLQHQMNRINNLERQNPSGLSHHLINNKKSKNYKNILQNNCVRRLINSPENHQNKNLSHAQINMYHSVNSASIQTIQSNQNISNNNINHNFKSTIPFSYKNIKSPPNSIFKNGNQKYSIYVQQKSMQQIKQQTPIFITQQPKHLLILPAQSHRQLNQPQTVLQNKMIEPMQISLRDNPLEVQNLNFKYEIKTKIYQDLIQIDNSSQQQIFTSSQQSNHQIKLKEEKNIIKQQSQNEKVSIKIVKESQYNQHNQQRQNINNIKNFTDAKKASITPNKVSKQNIIFVKQIYKQGIMYQGQMLKGMRHGKGKFHYKDGMYQGQWCMNKMQGYGKLYTNNQLVYEGNWKQDYYNGYGKLYNLNSQEIIQSFNFKNFDELGNKWKTYVGQFKYDQKHGEGILILNNNEKFQGRFKQDKISGNGIFTSKSSTIAGKWQQNKLVQILQ